MNIVAQYKHAAVASYMPGTEGFTMAVFTAAEVPEDVAVYYREGNNMIECGKAGFLPGTRGFTAAAFTTVNVPVGEAIYIKVI